ncbi:MAG: hypothetical protein LLG01_11640 [Planctomycetaceae bacterium]|nr:hypothetical protein [Planctomycetaceae bacterium]
MEPVAPFYAAGYHLGLFGIVLTIFYLYLAVRSERVKRPILFWLGAVALAAAMILGAFLVIQSHAVWVVFSILMLVLLVISFLMGMAAAFGGNLPVQLGSVDRATTPGDAPTNI